MNKYEFIFRLVNFLIEGQTFIGGWGNEPGPRKEANPLNTSEVLLGILLARDHLINIKVPLNLELSIENGINYLIQTQLPSGGWSTGAAYLVTPVTATGNMVSTCISIWAVVEYLKRYCVSDELKNLLSKSYKFICKCIEEDYCVYCPNLKSSSAVASAYCLLSLCVLNDSSLICDESLNIKISQVINIIDCDFNNEYECKEMVALLSFIGIKFLKKKSKALNKYVSSFYNKIKSYIINLDETIITSSITERQVVREIGKSKRDYSHYIPFWYSIAMLMYPDIIKTRQLANALYSLKKI